MGVFADAGKNVEHFATQRRGVLHAVGREQRETVVLGEIDQLAVYPLFTAHEVPHAPILGVTEALNQPQTRARGMVVEAEHATLGPIPIVNRPFRFVEAPQPAPTAPPARRMRYPAVRSTPGRIRPILPTAPRSFPLRYADAPG